MDLLQRTVDVDKMRVLIWHSKCTGWTTSNKQGPRPKNPFEPMDPRATYQVKKLEQGTRPSRISEETSFVGTRIPIIPEAFVRLCETYHQILFSNTGKSKYNILFNLKT